MKATLTLYLFLLALLPCYAQSDYNDLDKAIEKGKSKKSEKILLEIASYESTNFFDYLDMAQFYYKAGQYEYSSAYIGRAIDYFGDNPMNFSDDNFATKKDSLYKTSIFILNEIIKEEPYSIHYMRRASLKGELKLFDEALIDFNLSLELDSLNPDTYFNRGTVYGELSLFNNAISDYSKCIQLDSNYSDAHSNKGFTYLYLNKYELALSEFKKAFELSSNIISSSYILNNIGFAYYKLKNHSVALEFVNESIRINPINSYAYKNLALIEIALGKNKSACKNVKKSIDLGFVERYGNEIIDIQNRSCK